MKKQEQKGFVLFVVMIFLIMMSMLGITMFGGFIKDQKMSGNMREKQRAIEAAQAGMDNAQAWLQTEDSVYQGGFATGVACDANTFTGSTTPIVCNNALSTPGTLPWPASQTFSHATIDVQSSGSNKYASNVGYYVQFLGTSSQNVALYKVTSTAQGGNATAAAVLETVYEVKFVSRDVGGG